jgi:RNA polymerase primary sigma factor
MAGSMAEQSESSGKGDAAQHLGLVWSIAKRFRWAIGGALDLDDLVQAGALGLMRALRTYDAERGVTMATYAVPWIRRFIVRTIANQRRTVRVPVHEQTRRWRCGAPAQLNAVSLDAPVHPASASTLGDALRSEDENPSARVDAQRALLRLDERARRVLVARFFNDETLEEAGASLGVTRERARQLEAEALRKLRRTLARREL